MSAKSIPPKSTENPRLAMIYYGGKPSTLTCVLDAEQTIRKDYHWLLRNRPRANFCLRIWSHSTRHYRPDTLVVADPRNIRIVEPGGVFKAIHAVTRCIQLIAILIGDAQATRSFLIRPCPKSAPYRPSCIVRTANVRIKHGDIRIVDGVVVRCVEPVVRSLHHTINHRA